MRDMMAYCGLLCGSCPIHLATLEENRDKQAALRQEIADRCRTQYHMEVHMEDITDCDGCATVGGRLFSACKDCPIRTCAVNKGLPNCGFCPDYACENLSRFFTTEPSARDRLEGIRKELLP